MCKLACRGQFNLPYYGDLGSYFLESTQISGTKELETRTNQTKILVDTHVQSWRIYYLPGISTRIFRQQVTPTFLSIASTRVRGLKQTLDRVLIRSCTGTVGTAPGTDSAALPPMFKFINSSVVRLMSIPPEDGALTTLLLATDPEIKLKSLSGRYFDVGPLAGKFYYGYSWDATDSKLSDVAKDEHLSEMLWNWSVQAEASINITSQVVGQKSN